MGRPRKQIDELVKDGKKHLTKKEIKERKDAEVKAPDDKVVPPSWLTDGQKKTFRKLASELKRAKLCANLDCEALAKYIVANELYKKFSKKLFEKEVQEDEYEMSRYANLQQRYFEQCLRLSSEFGLTMSSRCKLAVPQPPPEPPPNKFAKFERKE